MNRKQTVNYVIQTTIKKLDEAETLVNNLYKKVGKAQRQRFIALNMLDTFLTLISPNQLAEYKEWRSKCK